ncbi:hypothetical protein Hanom_Chr01g00089851 [Helianthus anomalus]
MYNGDSLHITLIETLCTVAIQSDNREEFPTIRDQSLEKVLSRSGQVDSSFVTRLPRCQVYFSHYKHHNSVCDIL